jgi:putative PEP-CTERM system TPR-repeat lipoprotein
MREICFVLAVAIAFSGFWPLAFAADPKASQSYLDDAKKALGQKDLKAALILLKNAVQADPDNAAARYELGLLELRGGDAASAEKELRQARNLRYPEAEVPLAEAYLRQQKYDLLLVDVLEGHRPPVTEAEIRLNRGMALLALGRVDQAESSFDAALAGAARPARVLSALARVRAAQGDLAGARRHLEQALEVEPKLAEAWALRGQLRRLTGDTESARSDFDKALEIEPGSATARTGLAQLLIAQNEIALAQSDVAAVLMTQPSNGLALYLQALIQARQQRYRQAELTLQKLGPMLAGYPPALYLLAGINLARNQLAQAEDNINRYITQVPNNPSGAVFLGDVLLRRGKAARAIEVLEAAMEKYPQDPRIFALLSDAYLRNKQPDESAKVLDRITRLAPENAPLRTEVARQLLRLGHPDEAAYDLEAATKADPNAPYAKFFLILTYLQDNRLDDALKQATELRDQQPDNPMTENLLGIVILRKDGMAAGRSTSRRPPSSGRTPSRPR